MSEKIIAALKQLDVADNSHWTADGAPRLSALKIEGLTREDLAKVAPHFTRTNPSIDPPAVVADKVAAVVKAEKAPEVNVRRELEAEQKLAQEAVNDATMKARDAQQNVRKAQAKLDEVERALSAYDNSQANQADIMDYIAKQNAHRIAKHEEKNATAAAIRELMANRKAG